jgi:phosphatidylserine/phosphatidylglycerophosphate/cardiolipin synthase-like enzyme
VRRSLITLALALVAALALAGPALAQLPQNTAPPAGAEPGSPEAVVKAIDGAKEHIYVKLDQIRSEPVSTALIAAAKRGVAVDVVLGSRAYTAKKGKANKPAAVFLDAMKQGLPVKMYLDKRHRLARGSSLIIDQDVVVGGTFNITPGGPLDYTEVPFVVRSPEVARQYMADWNKHQAHSQPFAK